MLISVDTSGWDLKQKNEHISKQEITAVKQGIIEKQCWAVLDLEKKAKRWLDPDQGLVNI